MSSGGFCKEHLGYMPEYVGNLVATTIRTECAEFVAIDIPSPSDSLVRWRILVTEDGSLSFVYTMDDGNTWFTKVKFNPDNSEICTTNELN